MWRTGAVLVASYFVILYEHTHDDGIGQVVWQIGYRVRSAHATLKFMPMIRNIQVLPNPSFDRSAHREWKSLGLVNEKDPSEVERRTS
jgi:hypothetical protein